MFNTTSFLHPLQRPMQGPHYLQISRRLAVKSRPLRWSVRSVFISRLKYLAGTMRLLSVYGILVLFIIPYETWGFTNVYTRLKRSEWTKSSKGPKKNKDIGTPLFLTPLIESGKIDEARTKATVQHKEMDDVSSYSGFLTVNKEYSSNMFFWFFPAQHNPKDAPVILWLQGGPGATSLYGLFLETGPFIVTANKTLQKRQYTWNMSHNLLFIDNPVGTGFSFTMDPKGYATNETHIGRDVHTALVQFFKLFPELQANDFYVTGESYAGKYVPAVSHAIKDYNIKAETKINLKGLAIGNGYTDPINQLQYGDYLYQLGLIDANGRDLFHAYEKKGIELLEQKKYLESFAVFDELLDGDLTKTPSVFKNLTGYDYYFNFLQWTNTNDSDYMSAWLELPDVRKAIHVGNCTFNATSKIVEEYMKEDIMQSLAVLISDLTQHYKVLIYNGQLDIIVAYPLTENYLQKLKWAGAEKYKVASRKKWFVGKDLAGYTKTVDNLTEVLVRNAGHLVPEDQPKWALDLITRFTHNKPF